MGRSPKGPDTRGSDIALWFPAQSYPWHDRFLRGIDDVGTVVAFYFDWCVFASKINAFRGQCAALRYTPDAGPGLRWADAAPMRDQSAGARAHLSATRPGCPGYRPAGQTSIHLESNTSIRRSRPTSRRANTSASTPSCRAAFTRPPDPARIPALPFPGRKGPRT